MKNLNVVKFIIPFMLLASCSIYRIVPVNFEKYQLVYEREFNSPDDLIGWQARNNVQYNQNRVLFMDSLISFLPSGGMELKSVYQPGKTTSWQGEFEYDFIGAMVQSWSNDPYWNANTVFDGNCIIEFDCQPSVDSWCAAWVLQVPYRVVGYNKSWITPEIDVMENNGGKIDFCVHWGRSSDESIYNTQSKVRTIHKPDGKRHKYAVEFLSDGYKLYLDGKLVKNWHSDDPGFTHDGEKFIILNNASDSRFTQKTTGFIIYSVKVYK